MPENREPAQEWSRATLFTLLLVIGTGLALGWAGRDAALNVNGDDPIYLGLSRSIGHGHYRDDYLFGSPPHGQYPPGLPIWLLLVRLAAGANLDAALGANLLLVTLTAILLADAVRRVSTAWLGITAAAVVLWDPEVLALAGAIRSDVLFLPFCAAALWFSLADGQQARRWYPVFAITAALAAFLTRSAGIALIPAVGWALLLRRQWRPLIVGMAVSLVVVAAWFAYTRWAGQHTVGRTYAGELSLIAPVSEPLRLLRHALDNAIAYFASLASRQFSIPDIHNQPADNGLLGLFLTIPALIGAWKLSRRWAAVVMYLVISIAILLVFPYVVSRLLTVLVPWLVALILVGWTSIAAATGSPHGERIAIAVGVVLAGFGLARQVPIAQREQRCRATAPYVDPRCYTAGDQSYVAAARYVQDSLPVDAVIAASKPAIIHFLAQRRTMPLALFATGDPSRLLIPVGPVTAILLSRKFPYEAEAVAPSLRIRCKSLTLLARFPEGTLLLSPRTIDSGSAADACEPIEEYLRDTPPDPDNGSE